MATVDERIIDPIMEMTKIAQDILCLDERKFVEDYRSSKDGELIFGSEQCRINLIWGGWDQIGGHSMYIRYGRLHALNEKKLCSGMGRIVIVGMILTIRLTF